MTNSRLPSGLAQPVPPGTGWALIRGFFELLFALHWQNPDEGHFNARVLASAFNLFFKQDFISKMKRIFRVQFCST
jgi:hypothetical protein